MSIMCFHNTNEENGFLSNWYMSSFIIDNIKFCCVEQYMMYKKAMQFEDFEIADKILASRDPREIKKFGREVKNYDDEVWGCVRFDVVLEGNMAKFKQNETLKQLLLSTKGNILAEAAVNDIIWGIGLSMHDSNRLNQKKWRGRNLLGICLMMVRDELDDEK